MSGATTATMIGAAVVGGALLSQALTPKLPKPEVPKPEAPPQAAKPPEMGALRGLNRSAEGGPGSSGSTLLTGPGGVPDSQLALGKNTLLGG